MPYRLDHTDRVAIEPEHGPADVGILVLARVHFLGVHMQGAALAEPEHEVGVVNGVAQ